MSATMRSFFFIALFCLVGWSSSQRCPAQYKRFSPQHTYCLAPNRTCHVMRTGVSQQDKELILKLHNQFRSKVAMGNEDRAIGGRLPQAADMMQMEWDDELAAVAQKWTENCHWGHDCKECRAVENFGAGQNLAIENYGQCHGYGCQDPSNEPDWTPHIFALYDEVVDYYTSWLGSFVEHDGPMTGHFTQLIWSKSWKVGCGYSFYKEAGNFHKYYACNYGPGGNVEQQSVYKQGRPCSYCPTNTQCSTSSRGPNSFPGLCKMNNPNTAPALQINPQGLLFYCGASSSDSDCKHDVSGDGGLRTVNSIGGNYYSIVLNGGQSTTVSFTTPMIPHQNTFCLRLNFRKGPLDASRRDESSFVPNYKMGRGFAGGRSLSTPTTSFIDMSIDLGWGRETKFSFTFSVPRGAGQHVLDLRRIIAFDGKCASRKD